MKKTPIGLDLVDFKPDYTKSEKENLDRYREEYRAVYGEYPPEPANDDKK